ncbi:hypothetical protein T492DRAFT_976433 [Pavlovales sp. CCMP2436]|nr:hypothetical protein T492DRAFT_976433 [Pavlovales sp. CCMP2436]
MDVLSTVVLQLGSTAAAVFSAFLMLLLATTLHAPCVLCILSAAISTCLFAVTWNANIVPDRTAAVAYSASCAVLTSGFALGVYLLASGAPQMAGASVEESLPFRPPAIETSSSPEALRLSQRLGAQQARMFGAYWCSHCLDQKEAIGKEAMSHLPYVECAKDGADSQFPLCRQLDVPGYPTWEIGGRLFPGEKSVNELARLLDDKAYASSKQYVPGQPKQKS